LRELVGADFRPTEVLVGHGEPENVRPFRGLFRAPLRFDAERYALVFSSAWLHRRLRGDDPELRRMLQKQVDAQEARRRDDFPELVRRVLRPALLTGHAQAGRVAALFAMHARTLRRRLSAFDTSFRELLEESRYELARQLLEDSRMEVSQVAAALAYSEPSAFTRAFRRWSGTSPSRWRRKARARWARRRPAPDSPSRRRGQSGGFPGQG